MHEKMTHYVWRYFVLFTPVQQYTTVVVHILQAKSARTLVRFDFAVYE